MCACGFHLTTTLDTLLMLIKRTLTERFNYDILESEKHETHLLSYNVARRVAAIAHFWVYLLLHSYLESTKNGIFDQSLNINSFLLIRISFD